MNAAEQKVLRFIEEKKLIEKKDRIITALSGGADSVFLLLLLNKYKKKLDISLSAFHMNHGLRGEYAGRDEKYCSRLCVSLGIELLLVKENVRAFSGDMKISVEEAGRILRYKHMEEAARKIGYNKIATGHHADDNAETILLNLIKGAGPRGLSGIPPKRGKIIRPLLVLTRSEIEKQLNEYGTATIQDETNLNNDYERNYLRNVIIPQIKERFNPSFSETVYKTGEIFRMQTEYFDKISTRAGKRLFGTEAGNLLLDAGEFKKINRAAALNAVKLRLDEFFKCDIPFNDILRVAAFTESQKGKKLELNGGLICYKEKSGIVFLMRPAAGDFKPSSIKTGGSLEASGVHLSIRKTDRSEVKFGGPCEYIDAEKVPEGEFTLRRWKQGDKFYPLGLRGSKKISDFLTEQGIPSHKRKGQLVLLYKEQIVWVVGLRIDNRYKINEDTRKVLQLCLE